MWFQLAVEAFSFSSSFVLFSFPFSTVFSPQILVVVVGVVIHLACALALACVELPTVGILGPYVV